MFEFYLFIYLFILNIFIINIIFSFGFRRTREILLYYQCLTVLNREYLVHDSEWGFRPSSVLSWLSDSGQVATVPFPFLLKPGIIDYTT